MHAHTYGGNRTQAVGCTQFQLLDGDVVQVEAQHGTVSTLQFSISGLEELLQQEVLLQEHQQQPRSYIAVPVSPGFPYKDSNTGLCVLTEGQPAAAAASSARVGVVRCCVRGCKQAVARPEMRQHVAAHLLLGEVTLEQGDQACGFCGAVVSNARCTPGLVVASRS